MKMGLKTVENIARQLQTELDSAQKEISRLQSELKNSIQAAEAEAREVDRLKVELEKVRAEVKEMKGIIIGADFLMKKLESRLNYAYGIGMEQQLEAFHKYARKYRLAWRESVSDSTDEQYKE